MSFEKNTLTKYLSQMYESCLKTLHWSILDDSARAAWSLGVSITYVYVMLLVRLN